MGKQYVHIDESERRRIERLLEAGKSLRRISAALGRGIGTISDEVGRNSVRGRYDARKAEHKAYVRRKYSKLDCMKVAMHYGLRAFVEDRMEAEWSPELISGRIREERRDLPYASAKAIYKFIYAPHGRNLERYLYAHAVHKRGGPKRPRIAWKGSRTMIDQRPQRIELRHEFGHYEGDFIESGRDGYGSLLVITERKTRYPFLRYTDDRSTEGANRLVRETLAGIPVRSVTFDNDLSFQKHEELSDILGADIFFCHPQSPQEKGTVENRNRAIRRFIPKRSDLSQYAPAYMLEVERKLRGRPMKCLRFKTPQEAWDIEMERHTKRIQTKNTQSRAIMSRVLPTTMGVRLRGFL